MTISFPLLRFKAILEEIKHFSRLKVCKIRDLSKLIGNQVSICPAVKYGLLSTKLLERLKYLALLNLMVISTAEAYYQSHVTGFKMVTKRSIRGFLFSLASSLPTRGSFRRTQNRLGGLLRR